MRSWIFCAGAMAALAVAAPGGTHGSDGSDGAFAPLANLTLDLSLAATASWDTPSPVAGQGVYDPDRWAVVYKFTTINVPSGVTVTFANHPSGAPVIWLASGDVTIAGTLQLTGGAGHNTNVVPFVSTPGPGGFGGALGTSDGGGGFGPGGSDDISGFAGGGGHSAVGNGAPGGAIYGNAAILPLIGGSGGSTVSGATNGAGAGGGAILIASDTQILVSGTIIADGGLEGAFNAAAGKGSGGAIRLIADTIAGTGNLLARGGDDQFGTDGAAGRIRLETPNNLRGGSSNPASVWSATQGPVFPPAPAPKLTVVSVATIPAPADPLAGIDTEDVVIDDPNMIAIEIAAENVPLGTQVQVRIVPLRGAVINVLSTPLAGTLGASSATATVALPRGRSEIQLRANWTP